MDITRHTFHLHLRSMLEDISRAHFVAIDLEFTGIARQQNYNKAKDFKQTLQERYAETRSAAERYQILQVGLTCVMEDRSKREYVAKPYNFHLNPVVEERYLKVDRDFSMQSSAIDFLLRTGFEIDAPFWLGVPYLSRVEEVGARQRALERANRVDRADIDFAKEGAGVVEFVDAVRKSIEAWLKLAEKEREKLAIEAVNKTEQPQGLTNLQKRLVHQLVRSEYPGYVTISRSHSIEIIPYEEKREAGIRNSRIREADERIARQTGLRWLFEAMAGGDLSGIDPMTFAIGPVGEPVFVDLEKLTSEFNELKTKLKERRTVLVGHNVFTDLVNIYQTFFGQLPELVGDFQRAIHGLFPMVVDTKYLATHPIKSINISSSLEEIDHLLHKQLTPRLLSHPDHPKYVAQVAAHEAGYDSFVTARVMVRLSAKLDLELDSATEVNKTSQSDDEDEDSEDGGVPLNLKAGRFDILMRRASEDGGAHRMPGDIKKDKSMTFIPPFKSEFWDIYGNKLRVFGTLEEVCDLDII